MCIRDRIPDRYIPDEVLKLHMYKKIAAVSSDSDEEEIIDELIDRFGEIPRDTMNLIKVSRIRSLAEKLCITRIHEEGRKMCIRDRLCPSSYGD